MRRLELIANAGTIVLIVCAIAVLGQRYRQEGKRLPPPPPSAVGYQPGQSIAADLPGAYSGSSRTMIVAIQQHCPYCEASMPFYSEIIAERARRRSDLSVVFIAPETDTDIESYLSSKQVVPDRIIRLAKGSPVKITATPTMLLVDASGNVLQSRRGLLESQQQKEVMATLFGG